MYARHQFSTWIILVCLCSVQLLSGRATAQSRDASDDHSVEVAMKNVLYHFTDRVTVHITDLQGRLFPIDPASIVIFDDKNAFILSIDWAEIGISCGSLAQVLNQNVFSSADSPIKDVSIESRNNHLLIRGKLAQKAGVSFETIGTLAVTADGQIRLHAELIKAAHLPVKGLMDLLGLDLAEFVNTKKINGVSVDKDDIILDPTQILPPPHIRGKVTSVRIQGDEVVQVFGTPQVSHFATKESGNYMAYRNHDLRFGKLTMHDADLTLIDMDPRDPFDFFLDHYKEQLVAGYSKTTPASGLRVYMPDYGKLKTRSKRNHASK
jgi:hypothetical protein